MKEEFYTLVDGKATLRNLKEEEWKVRDDAFAAWFRKEIDEAILIYHEIYDNHKYDYIDNCIYQNKGCFLKEGDRVLDLGGNVGIFTNFAADKGASKIWTFEPIQENFQVLMMNRPEQCEAHRLAISSRDNKSIKISFDADINGGSICDFVQDINKSTGTEDSAQTVMTMSLDTLIDSGVIECPDFIKMDIEGAEYETFRGLSDENLEKVRCIAMEMHENVLGKDKTSEIYRRLERLGFKHFSLWNPDKCNVVWFWKE